MEVDAVNWLQHKNHPNDIASRSPFRRVVHTNLLVQFFSLDLPIRSGALASCELGSLVWSFVQIIRKQQPQQKKMKKRIFSAPFCERGNYLVRWPFLFILIAITSICYVRVYAISLFVAVA